MTIAAVCRALNRNQESLNYLNKTITNNPSYPMALVNRAIIHQIAGCKEDALKDTKQPIN